MHLYYNVYRVTVKAATLIFVSGRGSAFLSVQWGDQVLFIIGKELKGCIVRAFHENPDRIYTEPIPLKRISHKKHILLISIDPDQTASVGAV